MKKALLIALLLLPATLWAQGGTPAGGYNAAGGSSSSASASCVAPNCVDVTKSPYNASPLLGDNSAAFTAAFAASNAATTGGAPVDGRVYGGFNLNTFAASVAVNATTYRGDTNYVWIIDSFARAFTVTDSSAVNTYTQLGAQNTFTGAGVVQLFKTSNAAMYSSVTASQGGANEYTGVATISLPGVSGQSAATINSTGSPSTTPSISVTTSQANTTVLAACTWFNSGAFSLTSTSGTLRINQAASATIVGFAVWATYAANLGTVITSGGTLSGSANWGCQAIQVLGGGSTIASPTVYIPAGYYYYSSGVNPTIPTTIRCEPGTFLHYTGSAHAVDLGPIGGFSGANGFLTPGWYIDGCTFTGGSLMTEGIVMQPLVTSVGIRNSTFIDFGNAASDMIYGTQQNWDVEIGPQNRFIVDDFQPRHALLSMNNNASDFNSFVRIHDNQAFCQAGHGQGTSTPSCTAGQAGIGFITDSLHSRVYHNNIAFFNPDIWLRCSNQPCTGNNIESNQLETPQAAGTGTIVPAIQFSTGNDQLLVINNSTWLHSTGISFMGPRTGADTLTGSRVNWNQVGQIALATPLIALNNLAGNTANQSYGNGCSTGLGGHIPCALLHTVGGSNPQWDGDRWPSCTMNGSTGCTVTLSQNYGVLPRCTYSWNGTGALTGIVKVVPTAGNPNTVVVTSSVAADTALIQLSCSAGEGQ